MIRQSPQTQPPARPYSARVLGAVLGAVLGGVVAFAGGAGPVVARPVLRPVAAPATEPGAPELARPGPDGAGTMLRTIRDPAALDPVASQAAGHAVRGPRALALRIWYPARPLSATIPATMRAARPVVYAARLTAEPPRPPVAFTIPGTAVAGVPPAGTGYPVVVVSHGYDNDPAMMSWLGENLATKGYVVVAIAHRDQAITDPRFLAPTLLRRPLDIVQTLHALRGGLLGALADPARIALVGYSFGGYGVLTVGGARLDPAGPLLQALPPDLIAAYAGDGPRAAELHDPAIKAVVALAPAGGAPMGAWGAGMAGLRPPLLMLAGSLDRTVGYATGPAAVFDAASGSDRTLLTFVGAGHAIGTTPVPAAMRGRLWDMDWFEDPIWRKPRLNAISLHFITAFLALHLRGEAAMASYLAVPAEHSDGAAWTGPATPYDAVSAGGDNPTWKGFVRNHQNGLILRHRPPGP